MNGFLLDTNVPSELTRQSPETRVVGWLEHADDEQLFLSVISLGEIVKGIAVLPASKRRSGLQRWLDATLRPWFGSRILPVTEAIAEQWGQMSGLSRLNGTPLNVADGLIASTAAVHGLTVVTRNVGDFKGTSVKLLNPWS